MSERSFIASVSQLETFDTSQRAGCELRWHFEYGVGGQRSPQSTGAREGEIGHAHLAKYLLTGQPPEGKVKLGKAVRAAIEKGELPAPYRGEGDDFHVELRFDGQPKHNCDTGRWQTIDLAETLHLGGVPWEGFIDLTFRRDAVPSVIDHKFGIAPRETAKKRDELIQTIQLPVYVLSQLPYWPDAKRWEIAHHYVARKGVDSFIVRQTVHLDQVLERRAQIEGLVKRLLSVRQSTSTDDFKPNRRACDAYGGCPHQSRCPAFKGERKVALSPEEEALFGSVANVTVDPAPAAPPPPAAPVPATRRLPIVDVPADGTVCACGENVTRENGSLLQTGVWKHIGCKLDAVATPPDQPTSKPDLASEQPKPETPPAAPKARRSTKTKEPAPAAQTAAASAALATTPSPAETTPTETQKLTPLEQVVALGGPGSREALASLLENLATLVRAVV